MYDFNNQVVVVTGATGNLGSAVVHAFHSAGAKLALVDRAQGRLTIKFPELNPSANDYFAEAIDLLNPEAVNKMANAIIQRFGKIDVLVNTVGGFRAGTPVHDTSLATWDFLMNLNLRTALVICQAIVPFMIRDGSGKIINISARSALSGGANVGAYSVSKTAVLRLTESMSAELKKNNINVNCILPGTIDTPQNREAMPAADFSHWVAPNKIAETILFLASPAAKGVHGAAIPVYGLS